MKHNHEIDYEKRQNSLDASLDDHLALLRSEKAARLQEAAAAKEQENLAIENDERFPVLVEEIFDAATEAIAKYESGESYDKRITIASSTVEQKRRFGARLLGRGRNSKDAGELSEVPRWGQVGVSLSTDTRWLRAAEEPYRQDLVVFWGQHGSGELAEPVADEIKDFMENHGYTPVKFEYFAGGGARTGTIWDLARGLAYSISKKNMATTGDETS